MSSAQVIRKKIDNADGTVTLVFYCSDREVARTLVDNNDESITKTAS